MAIDVVFETHALSEDNERGIATGWLPGRLSDRGRRNAADLGRRRRDDGIAAVFTSDLRRAAETAEIAFGGTGLPILHDWRLRECDFGARNGSPGADVKRDRLDYCDRPYPGGGESHAQAIARVARCLADLPTRWAGTRIMLIGHLATYRALEHVTTGRTVRDLVGSEFEWRAEGWEYQLP
ncbi:histidine phosphatase family protein [Dactylosporangium sp. AC04546]|uniref:histidine phosphatase family protein n=1 Tax=Dactylosporangium sp. AC04546 TaxID=2862460 RepID=UPI001EDD7FF3|nr:histidine phosphatase family protein [Dactylosporangium sp. AC04546]WVK82461.1 histidine phosphatase family protein [Dactylosporangium sp. AC04546]